MRKHLRPIPCSRCNASFNCASLKKDHKNCSEPKHQPEVIFVQELEQSDQTPERDKSKINTAAKKCDPVFVPVMDTFLAQFSSVLNDGRKCNLCNFSSVDEINSHLRQMHFPESVTCTFKKCFKHFENQQELQLHFEEEHKEEAMSSRCVHT